MKSTSEFVGLVAILFSGLALGRVGPLAGPPLSATTYECSIRCFATAPGAAAGRWLHDKNHTFLVCSQLPNDLQGHVDQFCARAYGETLPPGSKIQGFMNYPGSPGELTACVSVGNRCTKPGPVLSMWTCPATCRGSGGTYPTMMSLCAASQHFAYQGGMQFYRTGAGHSLCRAGDILGTPDGTELFNDPPPQLCKSNQKECEVAP